VTSRSTPTRTIRERPDLDQLKRQAKELLAAFLAGEPAATAEVRTHERRADRETFARHDAQRVLARAYGFDSWPKLKAYVNGVTITRFGAAVRAGDMTEVRAMLAARPELADMEMAANDEHRPLHYAVLARSTAMVRVLMAHGADAHRGIYPRRDATTAMTFAVERGYDEIVAIIEEEEQRRREAAARHEDADADAPTAASSAGQSDRDGLDAEIQQGEHGGPLTARAAVALGRADWLRARHAEGALVNPIESWGGLLTIAAMRDRPEMLTLLLDLGFDPDERTRVDDLEEVIYTWGMPLMHCAGSGKHALAELLLQRGADPNAKVYASGTPVGRAYGQKDWPMVDLLVRHGGVVYAANAGYYRDTALARRLFEDEAQGRLRPGTVAPGDTLALTLLGTGATGGDAEIVRMALERIDWPRDDPRWYGPLEGPLVMWNHIPWLRHVANPSLDRESYITCFRLVLARCDANVHGAFGRTILHDVAASYDWITPDERLAFATMLLDAGAKLDARDDLLKSTPLGWACRWGRVELVRLFIARGADIIEAEAEPWATPRAWAGKRGHSDVLAVLEAREP
jgi:ankyrin repeat protein